MHNRVVRNLAVASALVLSIAIGNAQQGARPENTVVKPTPLAASAPTAVPALVPYSGFGVGADGKAITGEATVTVLVYKDETGGEPLFIESQTAVFDTAGRYEVQLGATRSSGIPLDLFATGEARWLEVQIAGAAPQRRALLVSVPYALKAGDSSTLGGLPASAYALAATSAAQTFSSLATANGVTPNAVTNVTTTGGTSGYIPAFNGTSTVVNSMLYQASTGLGVGHVPTSGYAIDVNGKSIFRGTTVLPNTGNATSSAGTNSFALAFLASAYNSNSRADVIPTFYWQAEPTGNNTSAPAATMNLLYNGNFNTGGETGFYLNSNGTIHFANGQTFPVTGTGGGTITGVAAGTGLTGGGTSGNVTLTVNSAVVPELTANNTFTGTDTFTASINESTDINIDNTNKNAGNVSPGMRFGTASGEGISSQRTSSGNAEQYGLDFYTNYSRRMSIFAGGDVEIGNLAPLSGNPGVTLYLESSQSDSEVFSANGTGGSCTIDQSGDLACNGSIYGSSKNFKIDDPLDPANKYLVHTSVESSEMLNIYSGNAVTDASGSATITLPEWFEAENGDFRYQLTTIGQDAHAWISQEVSKGLFKVSTNAANVKVSWQITATRQDAYAKAHPPVTEQEKPTKERGFYQHPELFGQPREKGLSWANRPAKSTITSTIASENLVDVNSQAPTAASR